MNIHQRVKAYIDTNGLSPIAVAQRSGISIRAFNEILDGNRTMYADDLKSICIALNVSATTFIDFVNA